MLSRLPEKYLFPSHNGFELFTPAARGTGTGNSAASDSISSDVRRMNQRLYRTYVTHGTHPRQLIYPRLLVAIGVITISFCP